MRVIVAHPEQQHSYRLAVALKKAGILDKYFTTVYNKKWNLTGLSAKFLPSKYSARAKTRHCADLMDCEVVQYCEFYGLLKLLCSYVPFLKKYYFKIRNKTADLFAKKVANYAIKNGVDIVITYDNCSPLLFEELKEKAPNIIRVLDMSAANLFYMKSIYEKDFELAPDFADRLMCERSYIWDDDYMRRIQSEIETTQFFLTPSIFVQRSLSFSGVIEDQMILCPYGVDVSEFQPKEYHEKHEQSPIEFIYVGGVKELKGISYLLECFNSISPQKAHLTIIGNVNSMDDIKRYSDSISFTGQVLHSQIVAYLHKADVFVFPSLGDSFSLSALEAAACGLPLIVSRNTGMSDFVTEGVQGFVIKEQSVTDLKKAVEWFIDNPKEIIRMGLEANKMARSITWGDYDRNIEKSIITIANRRF